LSPDLGIASLKMFGSLILVLGLIILILFLLKKLRISPLANNRIPVMRIIGTLNLAPKRAVALIEVCDQWLLVGIGTENVTLISKFDQPCDVENMNIRDTADGRSFHTFLQRFGLQHSGQRNTGIK